MMSDLTFQGVWRMDWGFGNPNKTAAFIALLMIAVWVMAYIRRWGFWVALAGFVGLGVALVHTFSRGGLLSLAAGMIPLLIWAPQPWPRSRLIAGLVALWIIVGAAIYLKAHERYTQGVSVEDRSISNRVQLWAAAPAMMVDAPSGWGQGNSGEAYMQWYQPLERHERYRTLVNSHLTWLVEFGWTQRVLYILGWGLILLVCWPSNASRWRSTCLGVWLSFFVAAFFSSVAESVAIWIIPAFFLFAAVVGRLLKREYPTVREWFVPLATTALVVTVLGVIGRMTSAYLFKNENSVVIGKGNPTIWIVYDTATMGNLYGKSMRKIYQQNPEPLGLLFGLSTARSWDGRTLVLGSALPENLTEPVKAAINRLKKLILLNPHFFPSEIGIENVDHPRIYTYFGTFSQSPSTSAWSSVAKSQIIEGAGDFLFDWPKLIFSDASMYDKN